MNQAMDPDAFDKKSHDLPEFVFGRTGHGPALTAVPETIGAKSSLDEILIYARKYRASDVHISPGCPIVFRQFGQLSRMSTDVLTQDNINSLMGQAVPPNIFDQFLKIGDVEYVHVVQGHGRFRTTLMKQVRGWELSAHLIAMDTPRFEDTGMPASCIELTKWAQGMVLITGPANSGKSTTMAALVELINQTRHEHIITIEQPIEIVFEPKQCQISQREIQSHTLSQASALRSALREDPDVLVVSELRDLQTIQLAITAAETGHLVFGTMNTVDAVQTISRLVDSFPSDEQAVMRGMISESLRGIISQQLIPRRDGRGQVAAYEVLMVNHSVATLIRERKYPQIINTMATGKNAGMTLMDNSLTVLANSGLITNTDVMDRAVNPGLIGKLLS